MKLLVATITFAVTIGALFLFDTRETTNTAGRDYAQILEGLYTTESPTGTPKIVAKKTALKTQTSIPSVTATASPVSNTSALTTSVPQPPKTLATTATFSATPIQTSEPTFAPSPSLTSSPSPASSTQPTGYQIEVVSITSPIKQNSIAEVRIKTAPGAQCTIKVTLPSGGQSTAKGLEPKTADGSGLITWSWRINWNTKPGIATIEINCTKDSQNFSKTIQMEIIE